MLTETTVVQTAQPTTTAPTEQPKPTEAAPQAAPPEKDQMSAKFAALARRERQARQIHTRAKQREEALLKKEQEIAEREKMWESEFRSSPLEALKRRGIAYQDITNAALNDGKFDASVEVKTVQQEIQKLREEQAQKEKEYLERQKQQELEGMQETINGFKEHISEHLKQNSEKYELTSLFEGGERIYQVIEQYFNETQKVMSIDEACSFVEQEFEKELEKAAKAKKFQSKYTSAKKEEPKLPPKTTTTLSNSIPSSSAPSLLPAATERDRMQRALAKLG